jgi:hypothetical protein
MKTILLVVAFFLHALVGITQNNAGPWTLAERKILLDGLRSSQEALMKEVKDLNDQQFHFRPDSSQWSVAEVTEHLGIYDELLFWDLLNNQYTDERPDLVSIVHGNDSAMVAYKSDPGKGHTPFIAEPLGRFREKDQMLDYFNRFRNAVISLVDTTHADFRLHFIYRAPDAGLWRIRDLQQYTLLWIAHTERHTGQIRRVKLNPKFPK